MSARYKFCLIELGNLNYLPNLLLKFKLIIPLSLLGPLLKYQSKLFGAYVLGERVNLLEKTKVPFRSSKRVTVQVALILYRHGLHKLYQWRRVSQRIQKEPGA